MTKTRVGPAGTPYSPRLDLGDWVSLAGQGGADPTTKELPEGIEAQTEQALRNVETPLQEAGLSFGDVASCLVHLTDLSLVQRYNALLNEMLIEVTAIARRR